jgi:hypothetical protein
MVRTATNTYDPDDVADRLVPQLLNGLRPRIYPAAESAAPTVGRSQNARNRQRERQRPTGGPPAANFLPRLPAARGAPVVPIDDSL